MLSIGLVFLEIAYIEFLQTTLRFSNEKKKSNLYAKRRRHKLNGLHAISNVTPTSILRYQLKKIFIDISIIVLGIIK